MTYLSDKSRNKKKRSRYYYFLGILFMVFYFWPSIRVFLYPYFEPVITSYGNSKIALTVFPTSLRTYFSSRGELSAKNDSLLLTIERLENKIAEDDAIIRENNLIQNSDTLQENTLVMYPVLKDLTSIYSTVVLSKGFKDGVEDKTLVYLRGRQPVCTIVQVSDNTSICKLLSASGVETEGVTAAASSSVMLSLIGDGGGTFVADVMRDTDVKIGDLVYLASDQSMTLGTITNITRNNQATSWRVYIRGAYNPVSSSVFYMNK